MCIVVDYYYYQSPTGRKGNELGSGWEIWNYNLWNSEGAKHGLPQFSTSLCVLVSVSVSTCVHVSATEGGEILSPLVFASVASVVMGSISGEHASERVSEQRVGRRGSRFRLLLRLAFGVGVGVGVCGCVYFGQGHAVVLFLRCMDGGD